MNDFLNFLNSADRESLTKVAGMGSATAERLIAARPFESVEDSLKVKGMGNALLERLKQAAQENESENRAMIPVEEEALPAHIEKSQARESEESENKDSFPLRIWRAFSAFMLALLRLILIVAFIGAIGAALYYGLPFINRTFIAPVEQNTAQIDKLQNEILALQTQVGDVNTRIDSVQASIEAQTISIQKLEEMQSSLESQLQTNNDQALVEIKHEMMMTRVLDYIGRARLYFSISNFGTAKVDVQSARDLLALLQAETGDAGQAEAVNRLESSFANLPDFPVVADGDLEIAWQILSSGEAPNAATQTFEATATPTFIPTSTPDDIPSTTPTP